MLLLNRVFIERRSVNDRRKNRRFKRSVYRDTKKSKFKNHRIDQERKGGWFSICKKPRVSLDALRNLRVPKISGLIKSFFRTSF